MSFVHKVSLTFFTRVLLILIGIAAGIVIVGAIGPEGKGILSLAVMAAALVFNATNMGIGTGSGYFLGRRKVPLDTVAGTWLSLSLMIGVSITIVALLLAPHLVPRLLPSVPVLFVSLTLGSVPFLILLYNYQSLFRPATIFEGSTYSSSCSRRPPSLYSLCWRTSSPRIVLSPLSSAMPSRMWWRGSPRSSSWPG